MFLGHKSELISGEWKVLPQFNNTKVLLNSNGHFVLQDNICPHQGSRIRQGKGTGLPVCPYHGWSWDGAGNARGSGTVGHSSGTSQCENTSTLSTNKAYDWCGFLFDEPISVELDISANYQLVEYRQDHIKASFVPVMDLFLDIDHIPVVHLKVYDQIDIPNVKDVRWETWAGGSAQIVTSNKALWLALYPDTMFEWQPGAVFVMVNEPSGSNTTISHVFKYRDMDSSDALWKTNEDVWETAWQQDRAQAELLEPGWNSVPERNLDVEKRAFRSWLHRNSKL
jgi:hypothetical protein